MLKGCASSSNPGSKLCLPIPKSSLCSQEVQLTSHSLLSVLLSLPVTRRDLHSVHFISYKTLKSVLSPLDLQSLLLSDLNHFLNKYDARNIRKYSIKGKILSFTTQYPNSNSVSHLPTKELCRSRDYCHCCFHSDSFLA